MRRVSLVILFILSVGLNIRLYYKQQDSEVLSTKFFPPSLYQESLDNTRSEIQNQLSWYNFSISGARGLDDLLLESGGKPLQSLIISTWKSGSTLLGQFLSSVPGTYYHFEPLISYGIRRIRSFLDANRSISTIQNLLECDYEGLKDYVEYGRKNFGYLSRNRRLWGHCKVIKLLCEDASFLSSFCKLFPFQVMKIVRLRLKIIPNILEDTNLNVQVILLVRDPRGVMQARQYQDFCNYDTPECLTPAVVCADMVSDFEAARDIMDQYPGRLMVLRYEDWARNPKVIAYKILKFLNIDPRLGEFQLLQWRKRFRLLYNEHHKWQKISNFSDVYDTQMACKNAMLRWGYRMAHNESHLRSKDFNPTGNLPTLNRPMPEIITLVKTNKV